MEKHLEILDLSGEAKQIVAECELTGKRTIFSRGERAVAILISYDEYLALRETVTLSNDTMIRARVDTADEDVRRNRLLLAEDLLVE
jgi:hypothetical protein